MYTYAKTMTMLVKSQCMAEGESNGHHNTKLKDTISILPLVHYMSKQ